ncbi:hypothetical protein FPF71_11880 [Algibacter amylolyticus]|uniref:STAS/SEC14 domain-containing protein n=1 Tax=Algibacter amylolyticus TaxID=1608400 RepID=A0A5M7B1P8_9FLAO|nr:hypothetical protein [Algibacter amylolyticus]KAA5823399.1 hypothetical protein F2B50_11880 [Algibacter amylolyticus]MBB5267548.1 hypothetical protein [Algibacter amylolyticus]TSJ73887.1 hypothetical protein FPF71_11880 [Algibacter amylolyticus]
MMVSIKETEFYSEVLKEFNYSFADVFVFKNCVVSEVKEDVDFGWDEHAEIIVKDVFSATGSRGDDLVFISNRINSYSVQAMDWLKFFKQSYNLKAYCVVSQNRSGILNTMIEKLFFPKKIKHFNSIHDALNFVEKRLAEVS